MEWGGGLFSAAGVQAQAQALAIASLPLLELAADFFGQAANHSSLILYATVRHPLFSPSARLGLRSTGGSSRKEADMSTHTTL